MTALAKSFDCRTCGIASFPFLGETEICLQCAYKRLKENFEYESWAHAGCLCLADGYEAYMKPNVNWSQAMNRVKQLREEYDEIKTALIQVLDETGRECYCKQAPEEYQCGRCAAKRAIDKQKVA